MSSQEREKKVLIKGNNVEKQIIKGDAFGGDKHEFHIEKANFVHEDILDKMYDAGQKNGEH